MRLKKLELSGFKSFAKKTEFLFEAPVAAIVGPNGSGKSNCAEAFRWVLGERSMKALRGAKGEDLIWNGTAQTPKSNRAGVTLTFDNHDRKFNIDFDEVAITREVYRDGTNSYLINGTAVRHRDIVELLANVSLGSSDHYIVHQGDADRILSANLYDRRNMIEDALGLRLYQWKIEESEKKLEKTEENLKQVESLRREIAPHLKYLKKQVEKVEQADRLRAELKNLYFEYLKREENYLEAERQVIEAEKSGPAGELAQAEKRLAELSAGKQVTPESAYAGQIAAIDLKLRDLAGKKDELGRKLGRLEGVLEIKEANRRAQAEESHRDFAYGEVESFVGELEREIGEAERLSDIFSLKTALGKLRGVLSGFLSRGKKAGVSEEAEQELVKLGAEKVEIEKALAATTEEERRLRAEREGLSRRVAEEAAAVREAERELYELRARRTELQGRLNAIAVREEKLRLEAEDFKREVEEGAILVDHEIKRYRELGPAELPLEERAAQEGRRRQLERIKIRLEDMGAETGDVMKEYKETLERDEFLAKEIADLEASAVSLRQIIKELEEKINFEFKTGIEKINEHFQNFFALMFGGGSASLHLVKEKKETQDGELDEEARLRLLAEDPAEVREGIEISVSLPRKKIRGLQMLSGGERALTSIALLFAMSQVNPPPFLILDETDAALDEANARRYGEMVENLAKHSQLIVITHNRETMSRADIIYGVTMGADGVSRLLSIKFDEAASYAK